MLDGCRSSVRKRLAEFQLGFVTSALFPAYSSSSNDNASACSAGQWTAATTTPSTTRAAMLDHERTREDESGAADPSPRAGASLTSRSARSPYPTTRPPRGTFDVTLPLGRA